MVTSAVGEEVDASGSGSSTAVGASLVDTSLSAVGVELVPYFDGSVQGEEPLPVAASVARFLLARRPERLDFDGSAEGAEPLPVGCLPARRPERRMVESLEGFNITSLKNVAS